MHWFRHHGGALVPALSALSTMALSPVLAQLMAPADGVMWISLCTSDGVEQTIAVPLGGADSTDGDNGGDSDPDPMENCQIACHAMCSRKDQSKPGGKLKD